MGFNKAFEDKKFMIFYVRKLSKLYKPGLCNRKISI